MLNNFSIRNKLSLIFIFVVILQGILIGFLSYRTATDIIVRNKMNEMHNMLAKIDVSIQLRIDSIERLAMSVATSRIVRNNLNDQADLLEKGRNKRIISDFFTFITQGFKDIHNIMIIDNENILYSKYDYYRIKGFDLASSELYRTAVAGNGQIVWLGMSKNLLKDIESNSLENVLTMVLPISDYFNTRIAGVLIIDLDPFTFHDLLSSTGNPFKNHQAFMLDTKNNLICTNSITPSSDLIKKILAHYHSESGSFQIDVDGNRQLVSIKTNELTGWSTINMVPYDEITTQSIQLGNLIGLTTLCCTVLVSFFINFISFNITKPLNQLALAMKDIEHGNFTFNIQSDRKDEIGHLTRATEKMVKKINGLINEVYRRKIDQKNAELKALQSQINPHFLYNTLDTINWMLMDKNEFEISELIIALGDLMKYSINKDNGVVTMQQEIENIKNYLIIQKTRMEDRLNYSIDIPDQILSFQIPKLILQPFVENAIVHGIEPKTGGGVLRIYAQLGDNNAHITIEDNGVGISTERLEEIRKNSLSGLYHTSIGVENVRQRLHLIYGEQYKLDIDSKDGVGTRITLCIPDIIISSEYNSSYSNKTLES